MTPSETLRAATVRLRAGTPLMEPLVAHLAAAWLDTEAQCQDVFATASDILPKIIDAIAGQPTNVRLRASVDTGPYALAFAGSILDQP